MANLAWHQKYHPNKACGFDNAIDYNAHLLRLIDRQVDKPDTARETQKSAYRTTFAVNEQEFRTLRSTDICPIEEEFVGFEELTELDEDEVDLDELLDDDVEEKSSSIKEREEEKPFFTAAEKKKWIRRAIYGGIAMSTLAIAAALGYWAFKPKTTPPTRLSIP